MGKDLHRSIRPFIENCLRKHNKVQEVQEYETDEYYYYIVKRHRNLPDVVIALCDEYFVSEFSFYNIPDVLDKGGVYLIAKPEATNFFKIIAEDGLIICKLKDLMGALNNFDLCTYIPNKD